MKVNTDQDSSLRSLLGCWNAGILGKWVLASGSERIRQYRIKAKFGLSIKLKIDFFLENPVFDCFSIPSFHE